MRGRTRNGCPRTPSPPLPSWAVGTRLIVVIFKVTYHYGAAIWGIKKVVVLELKRENVNEKVWNLILTQRSLRSHLLLTVPFLSQRFQWCSQPQWMMPIHTLCNLITPPFTNSTSASMASSGFRSNLLLFRIKIEDIPFTSRLSPLRLFVDDFLVTSFFICLKNSWKHSMISILKRRRKRSDSKKQIH